MIFEFFLPSTWWTETADSHCLLLDLPGFKKEEVRIRTDNYGHVILRGERQADDNKILHFEQSYIVPEGCNIEDTSATFEDETFYVVIPKKTTSKDKNPISASVQGDEQLQGSISKGLDNNDNNLKRDGEEDRNPPRSEDESFLDKLKKKGCLVFTAFLAIALGVLVSHRYQSTTQKRAKKRAADDA